MARKSVFITGAAAGIGKAIAEKFASEGWFVGIFDVDGAGVSALQEQLGKGNATAAVLDVTDARAWAEAMENFFTAAGGRLDVLVNNAGILASGPYTDIPVTMHHKIVDVNVKGVMNGCHVALPYLRKTPGSRVINMASASAIYGQPELASYAASKFAVRGLTEGLDLEWQPLGVRVMAIWPLFVQTAMVTDMKAQSVKNMGVKLTPVDVARVVYKAASYSGRGRPVHWTVGLQAGLFRKLVGMLPDAASRGIVQRMARKH